ncbi:TRAP transporter small permease [Propylenella binzhouense]|uniref:TRAP transporter small permease protein n=1 Tax=Propylenella binzhouense TaxID=2555902 RepID=A0A964T1U3_9HYPH|nr:TRAP transporter small permease [Propylenella binzhouense]MYZ46901.1 TRAP transporter small permease [Propylenella binzhouense]
MLTRIETITTFAASVLVLLLAFLTLGDVIGRNLLGSPLPGATELTELSLVGITFLLYPQLAYRQRHVVIDLFDNVTPPLMKRVQQFIAAALGAGTFAVLAWRLAVQGSRVASYGDVTPFLQLPLSPAYYFMAALSAVTAIAFLLTIFRVPGDDNHGAARHSGLE